MDSAQLSHDVEFHRASQAETVHDVIPYSELYGLHPRHFDFDRHFWMVPLPGRSGGLEH